jgi:ABC-type xylose transport system substrate-binding protein
MLVSASAPIVAIASLDEAHAAGETVGYSAPFLFAQFEVILQDRTATEAKKAGLNLLDPTNADNDSGKQITDVRNLVGAGAKGLIVVANDSKAIIPALDLRLSEVNNYPGSSVGENLFLNDQPSSGLGVIQWDQVRRQRPQRT